MLSDEINPVRKADYSRVVAMYFTYLLEAGHWSVLPRPISSNP
jgi:hypothetical protein